MTPPSDGIGLTRWVNGTLGKARFLAAISGLPSVAVKIAGLALSSVSGILLARVLEPEGYGIYSVTLAWVLIATVPARMGLPDLLVRETSAALERHDWGAIRGLWLWGRRFITGSTAATIALWMLVVLLFRDALGGELASAVIAGAVLLPALVLTRVIGAVLRGLRRVVAGLLPEEVLRPVFLLAAIVAMLSIGRRVSPTDAMAVHAAGAAMAAIWGVFAVRRAAPREVGGAAPAIASETWRRALWPMAATGVFQLVNQYADVILLGSLVDAGEAGVYRAATQASTLISVGFYGTTFAAAPLYARLWSAGQREELQKLVSQNSLSIAALCVPPALLMMFASEAVLRLLFGPEFAGGGWVLTVLASGQLLTVLTGPASILLVMTGNEKVIARAMAASAIANLGLNAILIPEFGMVGAAAANAASLVIWNVVLLRASRAILGMDTTVRAWARKRAR